ncbi:hypothetical protein Naga_101423g1 [Nannochloropsis gaditana]|uniref:Uncharacterized protein n=1 Tax=Nannochloropsis gaditana TaxID=72520 RepID=W7TMN9_9STRA|nr:hypothetical protein Naga_101423g1 [Nannochloropsis gaditana]
MTLPCFSRAHSTEESTSPSSRFASFPSSGITDTCLTIPSTTGIGMASQGLGGLGLRSRRRPRRPHPRRFIEPSLSSLPLLLLLTFFSIAPAQAGLLHRVGLAQINAKNPSGVSESTRSLKACNVTPSSPSFTSSFPFLPIPPVFLLAIPLPRKFARDCQHQGHAACASVKVFIQSFRSPSAAVDECGGRRDGQVM